MIILIAMRSGPTLLTDSPHALLVQHFESAFGLSGQAYSATSGSRIRWLAKREPGCSLLKRFWPGP